MSRKGDCWDNAVAESFFATLEWELFEKSDWHTHREAEKGIFSYIEVWYTESAGSRVSESGRLRGRALQFREGGLTMCA